MLEAIRRLWPKVSGPLQSVLVAGMAVFVFLWLPSQLNRHLEGLKRIGDKQTAEIERIANEQKKASGKPETGSLERPYFTQTRAAIQNIPKLGLQLSVTIKNNDTPADNVISHLLALPESLDVVSSPIHTSRIENANPIGPKQTFSHQWGPPINSEDIRRVRFIVLQIRYNRALRHETYSQSLYLKFRGVNQDGTFIKWLSHANSDEKSKLVRYMENRGISKL